jgi:hypothetical protein
MAIPHNMVMIRHNLSNKYVTIGNLDAFDFKLVLKQFLRVCFMINDDGEVLFVTRRGNQTLDTLKFNDLIDFYGDVMQIIY